MPSRTPVLYVQLDLDRICFDVASAWNPGLVVLLSYLGKGKTHTHTMTHFLFSLSLSLSLSTCRHLRHVGPAARSQMLIRKAVVTMLFTIIHQSQAGNKAPRRFAGLNGFPAVNCRKCKEDLAGSLRLD